MTQETRLPRNGKEGALYGAIICTLTCLFMTSLNVIINVGEFNADVALTILKTLPIFWVIVMIIEPVLIGRIAEKLVEKFTKPTDSFNAKILFRILFTVFGMSFCMTLIGGIIGNGFTSEIFSNFLATWPRNFLVVLIAETLVIQPIARFAMVKLHASQDRKLNSSTINAG
ncbi:MAG: DUF2798 domain-containing protein [Candidatus Pristimantibacillus sp.]